MHLKGPPNQATLGLQLTEELQLEEDALTSTRNIKLQLINSTSASLSSTVYSVHHHRMQARTNTTANTAMREPLTQHALHSPLQLCDYRVGKRHGCRPAALIHRPPDGDVQHRDPARILLCPPQEVTVRCKLLFAGKGVALEPGRCAGGGSHTLQQGKQAVRAAWFTGEQAVRGTN